MDRIDVSIIIVNYNTKKMTSECLESIFKHTKDISFEIILVDNASKDGSKEFFESRNDITYVYSNNNLGFGRANNLGYQYSHGDYIFLLNSDTLLKNNAVKIFYEKAKISNKPSCYGCLLMNKQGNIIHSYGRFPTTSSILIHYFNYLGIKEKQYDYYGTDVKDTFKVDFITGAAIFIDREIITKCGLFNEDYFMYYEETDMQKRFSSMGYFSYIITGPQIIHLSGGSQRIRKKNLRNWRFELEGSQIYSKKNLNIYAYYGIRIIAPFILLPKILFYKISMHEKILCLKSIIKCH